MDQGRLTYRYKFKGQWKDAYVSFPLEEIIFLVGFYRTSPSRYHYGLQVEYKHSTDSRFEKDKKVWNLERFTTRVDWINWRVREQAMKALRLELKNFFSPYGESTQKLHIAQTLVPLTLQESLNEKIL